MISQEMQTPAQPSIGLPSIRIYTLGPLGIEWIKDGTWTIVPEEHFQVRGGTIALQMLKLLLSQPQRIASNNWLIEHLWPESTRQEHRLDNVASSLRALLRPPESDKNLLYSISQGGRKNSGYRLAPYPQIWVDADAFLWNMEQATRMERLSDDGFPFWERAYELAKRGPYLPEEQEHVSAWAWSLRNLLLGNFRQCVLRSACLLQETGAYQEALLRLRTFWLTHPTDEDSLRPLMKLLAEQGCYQESLEYYEYLRCELAQENRHPDVRTQEVATLIRAQPLQGKPIITGDAADSSQADAM